MKKFRRHRKLMNNLMMSNQNELCEIYHIRKIINK